MYVANCLTDFIWSQVSTEDKENEDPADIPELVGLDDIDEEALLVARELEQADEERLATPVLPKKKAVPKAKPTRPAGLGSGELAARKRAAEREQDEQSSYEKAPRLSDDLLMPKDLEDEIKRVSADCIAQYDREIALSHKQRVQFFRGLVTYLFKYATPPMPEKYITNLTVHAVTQVIMDRQEEPAREMYSLLVEPWEGKHNI